MSTLEVTAERAATVGAHRLSELTGITPRRISAFINSPTKVTATNLERIKRALDALEGADA